MKRSIEDQVKLMALKQTAPPSPTLLEKPRSVKEDQTRPMMTLCGITFPAIYDGGVVVGHHSLRIAYLDMLGGMYCRPRPDGGCDGLSVGEPFDLMPPHQTLNDRDRPLIWQRDHPEFNPDDPNTWGSLFEPGGFAERVIRHNFRCENDGPYISFGCPSDEDINEMVDILRQFYAIKCGFIVSQTGSCCVFDDGFGGAQCSETTSYSCPGIYTPGGNCNGPNPCGGLDQNPIQQNDQAKKQTPIMDMVMSALKRNKMKKSIEDQIKLTALKQTAPPPPTLLEKPGSVKEDLMGGGGAGSSPCGVFIPADSGYTIYTVYEWLITQMYCREGLITGCYSVSPGQPVGGGEGEGQVNDRDQPLTWQRQHPEFEPADPGTWGSVFGPGGLAERYVRFLNCNMGEDGAYGTGPCPGLSDTQINAMVEILRQLYIARCGFAVAQSGSCCTFPDFGGAQCEEVESAAVCQGVFTPGGNCAEENPCGGLMPNLIQQNDEMKNQKQVMDMVMSIMKVRKKSTGGCVSQTVNGPLCIASDISREACQAMSDNRYGGKVNVWWFNGVPCDMESASRVDYNNGGILMNDRK